MRRVSFQSVLHGAARLAGLEPARDLREPLLSTLLEHINQRVGEGWRWDFWPEWTLTESRTRLGAEATGYYFPLEEAGKTTIETVKGERVFRRNPKVYPRNPWSVDFSIIDTGILVPSAPETIYVMFRPGPPQFATTVWNPATAYVAGDLRYYSNATTAGETYRALQAGTNKNPITETAYWVRVDFPEAIAGYVKRAAASDHKRSQGQDERAGQMLDMAELELRDALDRALESQGQYERAGVLSYGR